VVSQGAYLAYLTAMHSPDLIRAAVLFSGIYPAQLEYCFPEAKKHSLGLFIVHGLQDEETLGGARAASQKLRDAGVLCEFKEHTGGHEIPREDWPTLGPRVVEWLEKVSATGQ
jgi:predicted esterase